MKRPTNIFEHLLSPDFPQQAPPAGIEGGYAAAGHAGVGFAPGVPWSKSGTWALEHDTDGDGVPDAFDDYFGPGAHSPF
jgi:hypothetical protein